MLQSFEDIQDVSLFSFDKFSSGDMEKLFNIIRPLMENGTVDSENTAVQESIALLFKTEAGVEYTNEEPEMPEEDFNLPPVPRMGLLMRY